MNGVRRRLKSGVDRFVPVGLRVCPVGIPMILGHRQLRRLEIESSVLFPDLNVGALHRGGLHSGETQDVDRAAFSSGDGTGQQHRLEGDPLADRNVRPIHRWR